MLRRTAAILLLTVSLVALSACSSSDNAKKVDESATTTSTEEDSTTTEDETTTTDDEGLKSRIDLGGLEESTDGGITSDDEDCIVEAMLDDPLLSSYESADDLETASLADREAFFAIVVDCVGPTVLIDMIMAEVEADPTITPDQITCIRDVLESLTEDEGVSLLAGDETTMLAFQDEIATNCA